MNPATPATAALRILTVNGCSVETDALTLAELLTRQGYDLGAPMACAVNRVFVPRAQWTQHRLFEGDAVEIVSPVVGG